MYYISESNRKFVALACVVITLGSLTFIFLKSGAHRPKPSKIVFDVHLEVGVVAAEEMAKLIGNRGQLLLVVADTSRFKIPQAEAQQKGFLQAIKKSGTMTVVATEKVDPQSVTVGPEFGIPAETFFAILAKHPDVNGVVSFVGPPRLTAEDGERRPQKIPKVVAVAALGFPVKLKRLFEAQIVHAAIAPRFGPPPAVTQQPKTIREWFDRGYQVVTPEMASALPE